MSDLRHDLSTLPLNPPSLVRSLDAFEDSLAEGLRDEKDSVKAVLRNWTALRRSNGEYWQLLSRIFFSAVDEAMVGWYVDEFPPNREPLPEVEISFLQKVAADSYRKPANCIAMVGFVRGTRAIPQFSGSHYSLDLTGCEEFRDCTRRFFECGLIDSETHVKSRKDLRQAILDKIHNGRAGDNVSVNWTGRLSSEHQGRVQQKALERAIAMIFAEIICALEDHARDGSPTPTMVINVDAPIFNWATESASNPASGR